MIYRFMFFFAVTSCFFVRQISAQNIENYEFIVADTASFVDMSSGTTELIGANQTEIASEVIPMGFDFWFMGKRYTNFSVNSNGIFQFGDSVINTKTNTYDNIDLAQVSVFGGINVPRITASDGKIHYKKLKQHKLNQVVVEWKNILIGNNPEPVTFQLLLHEVTIEDTWEFEEGQIDLIYEEMTFSDSLTVTVGASSTGEEDLIGVNLEQDIQGQYGAINSVLEAGTTLFAESTEDGNRTKVSFRPPNPMARVQELIELVSNEDSVVIAWNLKEQNNLLGTVVYRSTDSINYHFIHQSSQFLEDTLVDYNVNIDTLEYWYRVYPLTEGKITLALRDGGGTPFDWGYAQLKVKLEVPFVDLGIVEVCEGEEAILKAHIADYQYFWQKKGEDEVIGTEREFLTTEEGSYECIVVNLDGFPVSIDTVAVTVLEKPEFAPIDDFQLCINSELEITAPEDESFELYEWYNEQNHKLAEGAIWNTSQSGTFYLKITNELGCHKLDTFEIEALPTPVISIEGSTFICERIPETTLTAQIDSSATGDAETLEWSKDGKFIIGTPELTVSEEGTYHLTVSNSEGCSVSDSVVIVNCCAPKVKIPNAFTPYNTPDNNKYGISGTDISTFKMQIYNRQGAVIFETDDPKEQWDGTVNGKPVSPTVYQMVVKYTGCDENKTVQEEQMKAVYLID